MIESIIQKNESRTVFSEQKTLVSLQKGLNEEDKKLVTDEKTFDAFSKVNVWFESAIRAFHSVSALIQPTAHAENASSITQPLSGETVTKSLGTIPAGESVTIQFKVTVDANIPANDFSISNTAQISAANHATVSSSTATTTIVQPASIAKAFGVSSVIVGSTTTLTFTISNGNASPLSNVSFTDPLPAGLVVADAPGIVNNCGSGTVTAAAGAILIGYAGGTRAANSSCTIVVSVKGATEGLKNNITNAITSTEGGAGNQATATLTVNPQSYSISGTVSYGTTPAGDAAKFVSDVTLTASGNPALTAATDSLGVYSLENLSAGAQIVTPSKTAQTDNTGISVQDASETAKIAFNINTTPTMNQRIAADATGDGTISVQDASEIAKRSLNISSANIVGQWKFAPVSRSYPNLDSNLTGQNYEAILIGDVTGNWTPPAAAPEAEAAADEKQTEETPGLSETVESENTLSPLPFADRERESRLLSVDSATEKVAPQAVIPVSLPNASGGAGTTVVIPVTVGDLTGQNVTAYDFTVSFDPTILEPASPAFDTSGTLTGTAGGYSVFVDPTQPAGRLRIGAFGTAPLAGQGTLINLRFNVLAGEAKTSPLNFEQFIFGEGRPQDAQAATTNGSFMRLGATAAAVSVAGRVLTAHGRGISSAKMTLTNRFGEVRYALTNPFGYYHFDGIVAGETYVLSVSAKNRTFSQPTMVINLSQELSEINFISEP